MKTILKIAYYLGMLIASLLLALNLSAQQKSKIGNWSGIITTPSAELEMIFKITEENGSFITKLDVPAQGGKDISAEIIESSADSLLIKIPAIFGTFSGKFMNDDSISGSWSQGGMAVPLNLKKIEKLPEINRPQTPKPSFPYLPEEVEYINENSGFKIAGTLTIPENTKKSPVVILISGSGAQDRDETIFEHKPFFVIADYFARNGIATLRIDDRGVGGSEGNIREATSEDFAGDVLAGINFLKTRKELDAKKIGLIGHSEGGLIAPIVANTSKDVAFIIMMAGPGIVGEQILYEQGKLLNKAAGLSDAQVEQNTRLQKAIFDIILNEKDSAKQLDRLQRTYSGGMYPMLPEERKRAIDARINAVNTPWFKYFLTYDPYPVLAKVKCPVLSIIGEKDLQVPAEINQNAIKKALTEAENKNFRIETLENLNHLFQNCETGGMQEYAKIEETIDMDVLKMMKNWIIQILN